ncbi:Bug family tripartite tricarboxylate transporter substrate binding protein [Bordetella bronchialis]|uniref:MFS transporter n=3 Tax=Bordetella bronchialis TaxID=463025 RepID=A0A193G1U4_9BORD|nr:tripartite tricarboxylate transporter substrate binding protein [Bordetella bronchialis]ANN68502.1 MFS transporter [Bordetella bronchialis]ANN73643.1 MFS transporter [Bordetella bronchialis]
MHAATRLAVSALCALGIATAAHADDAWPAGKPITYVVPFAPGGATDIIGRLVASKLGPALGTTVVVENRPGAGGNIGSDFVAKAKPDGYTLVGGTISSHSINGSLYKNMPYDMVKDFVPVALTGKLGNVLLVKEDSPLRSVADVLAAAKAKPGALSYGSSGNGTSQNLSGELFKATAKVDIMHVPFKGSAPVLQALLGGQLSMAFDNIPPALPLIQSGKLRALAVTSAKRDPHLPDVPTMQELGLKDYEVVSWQAVFAPAGTPRPIVDRLSTEILKILKEPDVRKKFDDMAIDGSGMDSQQLAAFQKAEVAKWKKLIDTAGIRSE